VRHTIARPRQKSSGPAFFNMTKRVYNRSMYAMNAIDKKKTITIIHRSPLESAMVREKKSGVWWSYWSRLRKNYKYEENKVVELNFSNANCG